MRIGWRLERSKRIKSVTKGSGTNEESMNAANNNPIPPKAGKLAVNQDLSRTQPTILPARPITWLSPRPEECYTANLKAQEESRESTRPGWFLSGLSVHPSNRCLSSLIGYKKLEGQIDNLFHADRRFRAVSEWVYTKSPLALQFRLMIKAVLSSIRSCSPIRRRRSSCFTA